MSWKSWSFQIIGQSKSESKQFCLVSVNDFSSVSLWLWITETSHYHTCQKGSSKRHSFTRNIHQFRASMDTQGASGPIGMNQRSMKYCQTQGFFFSCATKGIRNISFHYMKLPIFLYFLF